MTGHGPTPLWLRLWLTGLWVVLLPVHVIACLVELHARRASAAGVLVAALPVWRWPAAIVRIEWLTLADVWRLEWMPEEWGARPDGRER